ncbi:hypothetical protein KIN20_010580 [Parelaphostrongylus tenuis]|uniref:Uncharacterized protein n=1 Tax=Parelaphostrongylus tenuis TaxID=148309 RepID=A0AAD5M821_PARTN|nr:hypothetical protein KIN20_010580 [Parelaphostrongylus tenuis]
MLNQYSATFEKKTKNESNARNDTVGDAEQLDLLAKRLSRNCHCLEKSRLDDALLEIASACSALSKSDPVPLQRICQPGVAVSNRSVSERITFDRTCNANSPFVEKVTWTLVLDLPKSLVKITEQKMEIMQIFTFNLLGGIFGHWRHMKVLETGRFSHGSIILRTAKII